ncbi:hypothetical protein DFH09DRAFT_1401741 [Mycena vulgaris]|nr:hypothetical protein DFH09DRAFT_1401741 [Mycena vulgaris]
MLAIIVIWLFTLLASRVVRADFHFLNCVSTGPSKIGIPSNPTIVVPASDMADCSGVLGPRMVLLQNLTQPVGSTGLDVFSIDGLCGAPRLDVWVQSPDRELLGVYVDNGDGVRKGNCGPSNVQNYTCTSQDLSLSCTDSWTCFTGICEVPRVGSVTSAVGASASAQDVLASATASPAASTVSLTASAASSSKAATVVGCVLGVICLSLGLGITLLLWKRKSREESVESPSPTKEALQLSPGPDPLAVRPFQEFRAATPSLKMGMMSAPTSATSTVSVRGEGNSAGAGTSDAAGMEAFPPEYSASDHGGKKRVG